MGRASRLPRPTHLLRCIPWATAWPCLTTLDQSARAALPGLRDSYVTLAEALVALVNPNPFTPHAGTGGPNNFPGGPNGFPNFNMNFPPFSFDFPNSLFPNSDFS